MMDTFPFIRPQSSAPPQATLLPIITSDILQTRHRHRAALAWLEAGIAQRRKARCTCIISSNHLRPEQREKLPSEQTRGYQSISITIALLKNHQQALLIPLSLLHYRNKNATTNTAIPSDTSTDAEPRLSAPLNMLPSSSNGLPPPL